MCPKTRKFAFENEVFCRGAAQYGLDDSIGSVLGHGSPYGFGTDRLVKFQTEWNKIIAGWSVL